jgi:hypothetical protein
LHFKEDKDIKIYPVLVKPGSTSLNSAHKQTKSIFYTFAIDLAKPRYHTLAIP